MRRCSLCFEKLITSDLLQRRNLFTIVYVQHEGNNTEPTRRQQDFQNSFQLTIIIPSNLRNCQLKNTITSDSFNWQKMKTQNVNLQNCQLKNTDSDFFHCQCSKTFQLTKIDSIHIDISAYGGDNLIKNLAYLTQTHGGGGQLLFPGVFSPVMFGI